MAWVRRRQTKGGTKYLAGYTDPTGAQRSAGTFRSRSGSARSGSTAALTPTAAVKRSTSSRPRPGIAKRSRQLLTRMTLQSFGRSVCLTTNLSGVVPGIIDTHVHQWDPLRPGSPIEKNACRYQRHPRMTKVLFPLAPRAMRETVLTPEHLLTPYLPSHLAADTASARHAVGVPVEAVVHIEASHTPDAVEETKWVIAQRFGTGGAPRLGAVVGRADPRQADFAATLDRHTEATELFRGVRLMTTWHVDPQVLGATTEPRILRSRAFLNGFAALAERELSFDAYVYSGQLGDVAELAAHYPGTTIVLDHYGPPVGLFGPRGKATGHTAADRVDILTRWKDDLSAVALHPNVVAKHSGLAFPALGHTKRRISRAQLVDLVAPLIEHTTEEFGEDRIMFGSNYPMDKAVGNYDVVLGALADVLAPRGDAALRKVFRDNAKRVYRIA